ncbi:unnamed protein product [Chrysoparadoxa australica]
MVLANKALAFQYQANLEILLVVYQCLVAVVLVEGARRKGFVEQYSFSWQMAMQWAPVNVMFCLMLFTSFMADTPPHPPHQTNTLFPLQYMNVPLVTVFKNLTNIAIVYGDWYLNSQQVSALIVASLGVMLGGALLAGANDIEFTFWGYFWMVANCCSTAGYVLYMKYATKSIKLSKFGMVFYNNILGLMLLTPVALLKGELGILASRTDLHTLGYAVVNTFAGAAGFMLNFASLWCVGSTSATTYAIVGSVNKLPVSILGYYMFKTPISPQTAIYASVSLMGGFLYSYAKFQESRPPPVLPKSSEEVELMQRGGKEGFPPA